MIHLPYATVLQTPDDQDVAPNPMAVLSRLSSIQEMMTGFILPATDVVKATRRAQESTQTE